MKSLSVFTTLGLIFIASLTTNAQNATVKEVRELYANAQQMIADMKSEPNCANYMTVTKHYIVPAIGPVEETLEFFAINSSSDEEEEEGGSFSPLFIRQKISAEPTSMGTTCREFLYDPETSSLRFYFCKTNAAYVGEQSERVNKETRAYYDKDGGYVSSTIKQTSFETGMEIKAQSIPEDGYTGSKLSLPLTQAFYCLMNQAAD